MTRLMDSVDCGPAVSHYLFSARIPSLAQGSMGRALMVTLPLQEVKPLLLDIFSIQIAFHCWQQRNWKTWFCLLE